MCKVGGYAESVREGKKKPSGELGNGEVSCRVPVVIGREGFVCDLLRRNDVDQAAARIQLAAHKLNLDDKGSTYMDVRY